MLGSTEDWFCCKHTSLPPLFTRSVAGYETVTVLHSWISVQMLLSNAAIAGLAKIRTASANSRLAP